MYFPINLCTCYEALLSGLSFGRSAKSTHLALPPQAHLCSAASAGPLVESQSLGGAHADTGDTAVSGVLLLRDLCQMSLFPSTRDARGACANGLKNPHEERGEATWEKVGESSSASGSPVRSAAPSWLRTTTAVRSGGSAWAFCVGHVGCLSRSFLHSEPHLLPAPLTTMAKRDGQRSCKTMMVRDPPWVVERATAPRR